MSLESLSAADTLHRVRAGELLSSKRDASFYSHAHGRGRGAHARHVIRDDGAGACGIPVLMLDDALPAADAEAWERCQRPGCRVRWPS